MSQDDLPLSTRQPLQEVVDEFGPPEGDGPVPRDVAETYRGRVPDALVDFWIEHGRGSWRKGLFWLGDPEPLMPVMRQLFANDPEIDMELLVPYLWDAFGDIIAWHPRLKLVSIYMNLGEISNTDITVPKKTSVVRFDDNAAVASPVDGSVFDDNGWESDATGGPVFDAVYDRLGPIREDQVYVMTPHFRLGGEGAPEEFSIGGLVEYRGFLAQIGPFARMKYIDPKDGGRGPFGHSEPVRTIGHDRLIEE